jgi:hypothetical protein
MTRAWSLALILAVRGLRAEPALPEGARPELAVLEAPQALSGWAQALASLGTGQRATVSAVHFGRPRLRLPL